MQRNTASLRVVRVPEHAADVCQRQVFAQRVRNHDELPHVNGDATRGWSLARSIAI